MKPVNILKKARYYLIKQRLVLFYRGDYCVTQHEAELPVIWFKNSEGENIRAFWLSSSIEREIQRRKASQEELKLHLTVAKVYPYMSSEEFTELFYKGKPSINYLPTQKFCSLLDELYTMREGLQS